MSRPFFYCSDLSRAASEKSFGTATVGEVWVLVEYREAWGAKALKDSDLSVRVKAHLTRLVKTIPRAKLLFVKQERLLSQGELACFVVRCRESAPSIVKFNFSDYEQLTEIDVAAVAAGESLAGGALTNEPLYLVCTHGKRDKCCAKFGYALYKSLRAGAGGERVWQSSHIGGDRFAANLVCFPHGLFYAHVTEEQGGVLVGDYERARVTLEGYRGRACYSYPVQAAEFFIRRESGVAGVDALRYLEQERVDDRCWLVRFVEAGAGTVHEAHIAARMSEFHNLTTCHSTEEKRVVQYTLENYRAGVADLPERK
ncbi:MAG TPA: sucrase ferredoxin [Pyrinomonadaceae bacterium]|nr:sucrase ferredoxin [Pyrinomonadaceae bacterium]